MICESHNCASCCGKLRQAWKLKGVSPTASSKLFKAVPVPIGEFCTVKGEIAEVAKVGSLLPKTAMVGRVAKVKGGWALDVEHHHASRLVEEKV